ncbi:flavoprotein [Fusarium oxysporum f. sp. albedinis]|nr:flavoprotein [Fusarium oxysporum f. sp. albedinis]
MQSLCRPSRQLFLRHSARFPLFSNRTVQIRPRCVLHWPNGRPQRIIVAVTGATGAPLAVTLLHRLRELGVETHLIMSKWGGATLKYELDAPNNTPQYLESLASVTYSPLDVSASISSGSFPILIVRAASVTLKERRRLVLVARETPLSSIHLENMLEVTKASAVVFPPVMAFYTQPNSIQDMVDQSVMRMIDLLDLKLVGGEDEDGVRWAGFDWATKGKPKP